MLVRYLSFRVTNAKPSAPRQRRGAVCRIRQTIPQTLNTMHFISVNQPNLCHQCSIPFGKAKNPNPESRTKHLNRFLTTYRNDKGIRPLSSLIINHCFYPCSIPFRYATHGLQTRASEVPYLTLATIIPLQVFCEKQ